MIADEGEASGTPLNGKNESLDGVVLITTFLSSFGSVDIEMVDAVELRCAGFIKIRVANPWLLLGTMKESARE
jgi:hypothetical protein